MLPALRSHFSVERVGKNLKIEIPADSQLFISPEAAALCQGIIDQQHNQLSNDFTRRTQELATWETQQGANRKKMLDVFNKLHQECEELRLKFFVESEKIKKLETEIEEIRKSISQLSQGEMTSDASKQLVSLSGTLVEKATALDKLNKDGSSKAAQLAKLGEKEALVANQKKAIAAWDAKFSTEKREKLAALPNKHEIDLLHQGSKSLNGLQELSKKIEAAKKKRAALPAQPSANVPGAGSGSGSGSGAAVASPTKPKQMAPKSKAAPKTGVPTKPAPKKENDGAGSGSGAGAGAGAGSIDNDGDATMPPVAEPAKQPTGIKRKEPSENSDGKAPANGRASKRAKTAPATHGAEAGAGAGSATESESDDDGDEVMTPVVGPGLTVSSGLAMPDFSSFNSSPLLRYVSQKTIPKRKEFKKFLKENPKMNLNEQINGWSAAHILAMRGKYHHLGVLNDMGADLTLEVNGWNLFHILAYFPAMDRKREDIELKTLCGMIAKQTNRPALNKLNPQGASPLCIAAALGRMGIFYGILFSGANPNVADRSGLTPLHHAAISQAVKIIALLLDQHVIKPSLQTNVLKMTPLMLTADRGLEAAFNALIEHPDVTANLDLTDSQNRTCQELVLSGNYDASPAKQSIAKTLHQLALGHLPRSSRKHVAPMDEGDDDKDVE